MADIFFATDPSELPTRDVILSMSGLDFMQAMLDGGLPGASIAQTMGFKLHSVAEGKVCFRGAPGFAHLNPVGAVHGGWYGTLLDSALGCAVMTKVPKGSLYTTLEYKVNIIRPVKPGALVDCVATTDHAGRSTGVATGHIIDVETGKLYATGSTTCIIMTP